MRSVIALLLLTVIFSPGRAQKDKGVICSALPVVSLSYPGYVGLETHGAVRYGRHLISAGPGFPLNGINPQLFEMGVRYRFFLNRDPASVDVFVQYGFIFQRRKEHQESVQKGNSIHNRLGYGFTIKISRSIKLIHSLSGGMSNTWFSGEKMKDISVSADAGILIEISGKK
ncbi:MAG: hypothetical protein JXA03_03405 [Bacteroidales bacterium]|nr:hypothetical protein [Bacteroidales bacterium]